MSVTASPERLRVHPAVFYRRYPEFVVLFQTAQREVLTLSDSAADILDRFRDYRTVDDAVEELRLVFDVDDEEDFSETVRGFAADMRNRGVLLAEYKQTEQPADLERQITDSFSGTGQLYSVSIELTYRCNERCRHCYVINEHRPELTTTELFSVLDQLADMNVCNIVFTGGEVFLRKDAFDILEYAYGKGFVIDVFTNGTLLSAEDCIRLKAVWPRCVHFSVYSHIPAKHDAITLMRGSHIRTLSALRTCVAIGIPVNIKTPVLTETMDDIAEVVALAESLGASIELGRSIVPRKDGDLLNTGLKVRRPTDYQTVSQVLDRLIPSIASDQASTRSQICGAGEHSICINPYGEVYPCNTFPIVAGDVTKQSVRQIWDTSEQLVWWRKNNSRSSKKGCANCTMIDSCIFCPGEAMLRTGDPLLRYDEACSATTLSIDASQSSTDSVMERR